MQPLIISVIGEIEEEKYVFVELAIDGLKTAIAEYYKKKEKEEKAEK